MPFIHAGQRPRKRGVTRYENDWLGCLVGALREQKAKRCVKLGVIELFLQGEMIQNNALPSDILRHPAILTVPHKDTFVLHLFPHFIFSPSPLFESF